jgi:EAL domain-containing protein (putative c-di-GMP-specific phosphodiesterase class I)
MRYFATKTRCTLLAEGIETEAEAAMLWSLAVRIGQGFLLGRPAAVP